MAVASKAILTTLISEQWKAMRRRRTKKINMIRQCQGRRSEDCSRIKNQTKSIQRHQWYAGPINQ